MMTQSNSYSTLWWCGHVSHSSILVSSQPAWVSMVTLTRYYLAELNKFPTKDKLLHFLRVHSSKDE